MMCLAVDRSLGKLAKWLRILGFDTLYESDVSGRRFYEQLRPERILLTRIEKNLATFTGRRVILITSDQPMSQLQQVVNETGMTENDVRLFSRCLRCNAPTEPIAKEDVYGMVPDYTWEIHEKFQFCRHCEQIYWKGSHWRRSRDILAKLFGSGLNH